MVKPKVRLTGTDGNVFAVIGAVAGALKRAGLDAEAREFTSKAFASESYGEVLMLAAEYAEVS